MAFSKRCPIEFYFQRIPLLYFRPSLRAQEASTGVMITRWKRAFWLSGVCKVNRVLSFWRTWSRTKEHTSWKRNDHKLREMKNKFNFFMSYLICGQYHFGKCTEILEKLEIYCIYMYKFFRLLSSIWHSFWMTSGIVVWKILISILFV